MDYSVNINVFQGPFELLYHLIEKKEIDIYDIPISEITDQYLEYLEEMMQFNMNVASEFIYMAATLIEIKSQMLLPQKEKAEDPRQELVAQLLEYKLFKDISEELKKYEEESSFYISKPREEMALTSDSRTEQLFLNEVTAYELYNIYLSLIKKQNFKIDTEEKFKVYRESYRVKDCMEELMKKIKKFGKISLFDTFKEKQRISKEYVITLFLAVLELTNNRGMKIYQDRQYGDIIICRQEKK
ncbi:MAG TPA: segregation/condensation protein A [Sedimentibacter sp.]|nr:segregation/condensation protein A [Sedimentibacter sp.]HHZ00573.1 segregation/condensation protein A [Tissierellia bacterium]HOK49023.1 segregation/condensation protein A [Sedimentibacter sp.]HOW22051.1 segregation/condensation protein A [Sedimentibacter sp.]HRC79934.1 segregation/condensation protein A [Sedimentibacter sp.]